MFDLVQVATAYKILVEIEIWRLCSCIPECFFVGICISTVCLGGQKSWPLVYNEPVRTTGACAFIVEALG